MRVRQPAMLDVLSVLDAAFAVRDTDPEYFGEWVRDVYTSKAHRDPQDPEHWRHAASSLGECVRKHVLARSGAEREETTVQSQVTFAVGDIIHVLIQMGLAVHPEYTLLTHETGGRAERDGVTLSALCDAVYLDPGGQCCIIDVKSEREGKFKTAREWREEDARKEGRQTTEKPEHALQLRATAAVIHRNTEYRPMWGWLTYFGKNSGTIDPQPVPLGVQPVLDELERREEAWTTYRYSGALPPVLDDFTAPNKDRKGDIGKALCTPRSADDRRGVWCAFRSECERHWKAEKAKADAA